MTIKAKLKDKGLLSLEQVERNISHAVPEFSELVDEERAALRAGQFIQRTRKTAALSQSKLAEKLGVSQARISQMEMGIGRYGPSLGLLERIATACGGSLDLLFVKH